MLSNKLIQVLSQIKIAGITVRVDKQVEGIAWATGDEIILGVEWSQLSNMDKTITLLHEFAHHLLGHTSLSYEFVESHTELYPYIESRADQLASHLTGLLFNKGIELYYQRMIPLMASRTLEYYPLTNQKFTALL